MIKKKNNNNKKKKKQKFLTRNGVNQQKMQN